MIPFFPAIEASIALTETAPPLNGKYAVGVRHFWMVDPTREDVSTGTRQLMVSLFYPAQADEMAPRARITDILAPSVEAGLDLLARESQLEAEEKTQVFAELRALALRAQRDLVPEPLPPCPVLIYYPGGLCHRFSNAALCERLASAGYMVFALDAPRDAPLVVFPDEQRVLQEETDEDYIWPRVTDVRCLLDAIEQLNATGDFAGTLDLKRIGMFGHSRGGYLSTISAVEDERVHVAVNMDGFLWGLWTEGTGLSHYPEEFQARARALSIPILRLRGEQGSADEARRGFEAEARDFGGDFISIALHGYQHGNFSTTPWLNGQPAGFDKNARQFAPPAERIELLTQLLTDFFDGYLREEPKALERLLTPRPAMDTFFRAG